MCMGRGKIGRQSTPKGLNLFEMKESIVSKNNSVGLFAFHIPSMIPHIYFPSDILSMSIRYKEERKKGSIVAT